MALRHWAMSNHFVHHGGAGLRMLGFCPEQDIRQIPMDFLFNDNAEERSKDALMKEIPQLIFNSADNALPPTLGSLFSRVCNKRPPRRPYKSVRSSSLSETKRR